MQKLFAWTTLELKSLQVIPERRAWVFEGNKIIMEIIHKLFPSSKDIKLIISRNYDINIQFSASDVYSDSFIDLWMKINISTEDM